MKNWWIYIINSYKYLQNLKQNVKRACIFICIPFSLISSIKNTWVGSFYLLDQICSVCRKLCVDPLPSICKLQQQYAITFSWIKWDLFFHILCKKVVEQKTIYIKMYIYKSKSPEYYKSHVPGHILDLYILFWTIECCPLFQKFCKALFWCKTLEILFFIKIALSDQYRMLP